MGRNRSNLSEGATKTKQRSDGQGRGVSWGWIKYERRLGRPMIGRSRFYLLKKTCPQVQVGANSERSASRRTSGDRTGGGFFFFFSITSLKVIFSLLGNYLILISYTKIQFLMLLMVKIFNFTFADNPMLLTFLLFSLYCISFIYCTLLFIIVGSSSSIM